MIKQTNCHSFRIFVFTRLRMTLFNELHCSQWLLWSVIDILNQSSLHYLKYLTNAAVYDPSIPCPWTPQGYRCFKMVMFFSGFMLGSAATLLLYHKEPMLDAQLALESKAGISLAVGVLTGLMTMLVPTMGLLFSGLQLGGLLAVTALVVVGQFQSLSSLWVPLSGSLAASVVFAVVTLMWQKLFAIIYTSALGAGAVTLCADHLMGASALPDQVYDMLHQGAPRRLCWFNWAIAGIFPTLSLMGVLVQWSLTARGLSHRSGEQRESATTDGHLDCCYCQ